MMPLSRLLSSLALLFGCALGVRVFRVAAKDSLLHPPPSPPLSTSRACGFTTKPVERNIGRGYRSFVYTEPYRASLFTDGLLLSDAAWQRYTRWLKQTIRTKGYNVDPFNQTALLTRQRDIFVKYGFPSRAFNVILGGRAGGLHAANCIESALTAKQNERHPLTDSATEYGAFILLDRKRTTVKVYLQTGPTASVPGLDWAFQQIEQDLDNGFHVLTFLHKHPFFVHKDRPGNPGDQDIAGTAIPSGPDLSAFATFRKSYGCQEAWITNGHDSFRLPLSQLGEFDEGSSLDFGDLPEGSRPEFDFGDRPEVLLPETAAGR